MISLSITGKNCKTSWGLECIYSMDACMYDPAIARFTSLDPVLRYKQSPYVAF